MDNTRDFYDYIELCKDFVVYMYNYIDDTEFYI